VLVPAQAGPLRVPGLRLSWWDVRAGVERTASLPDLELDVLPGIAGAAVDDAAQAAFEAGRRDRAAAGSGPWRWLAIGFALLWLATLAWLLRERRRAAVRVAGAAGSLPLAEEASGAPATSMRDLQRVLQVGDPAELESALCGLASPRAAGLDALAALLDDPAQRAAIARLQAARWGDGDMVQARQALRGAFASGPRWRGRAAPDPARALLPPLYPEGGDA